VTFVRTDAAHGELPTYIEIITHNGIPRYRLQSKARACMDAVLVERSRGRRIGRPLRSEQNGRQDRRAESEVTDLLRGRAVSTRPHRCLSRYSSAHLMDHHTPWSKMWKGKRREMNSHCARLSNITERAVRVCWLGKVFVTRSQVPNMSPRSTLPLPSEATSFDAQCFNSPPNTPALRLAASFRFNLSRIEE
jgi:hypothetical protein